MTDDKAAGAETPAQSIGEDGLEARPLVIDTEAQRKRAEGEAAIQRYIKQEIERLERSAVAHWRAAVTIGVIYVLLIGAWIAAMVSQL